MSSPVEHLTLHYQVCQLSASWAILFINTLVYKPLAWFHINDALLQVRHLDTSEKSELHKLQQLKDEQGQHIYLCFLAFEYFLELPSGFYIYSCLLITKLRMLIWDMNFLIFEFIYIEWFNLFVKCEDLFAFLTKVC